MCLLLLQIFQLHIRETYLTQTFKTNVMFLCDQLFEIVHDFTDFKVGIIHGYGMLHLLLVFYYFELVVSAQSMFWVEIYYASEAKAVVQLVLDV